MSRGQAHALEGIVAGLVLLSGLIFALQATAVTPLSASTSSQHIEKQLEASAEGTLAAADANGSLKNAILHWNESTEAFYGVDGREHFTAGGPPNEFGTTLNRRFTDRGVAFNVYLLPLDASGDPASAIRLVYRGAPSDNAAAASRVVTIHGTDRLLLGADEEPGPTVGETRGFYAGADVAPHSTVHNLVRVRVVVWRM